SAALMCYDSFQVIDRHRPCIFVKVLADLHEFQGRLFFSRLHYTQRQILSILPEKPIHLP
ncbi:hypothetical protein, partial [Shigella sonnei]|uniref:hypothetical protein n=1 Tax=Shigella sonnei TaxID=624 RepID=UPI003396AD8E